MRKRPRNKQLRDLERHLPDGYSVGYWEKEGGSENEGPRVLGAHLVVLTPSGKPLREASGQTVRVPSTPGDHRSMKNALARIRRAIRESAPAN